jgi:hypothetical protein
MKHKQIAVTLYDGTVLPKIDEPLAELVRLLNRPDLWTSNCCQGDEGRSYQDAYIAVDGPLAYPLVHRLLDDQLDCPTNHISDNIVFDTKIGESGIAIRWCPSVLPKVIARFRRVLSEKTFNRKITWRSKPSEHVL